MEHPTRAPSDLTRRPELSPETGLSLDFGAEHPGASRIKGHLCGVGVSELRFHKFGDRAEGLGFMVHGSLNSRCVPVLHQPRQHGLGRCPGERSACAGQPTVSCQGGCIL